MVCLGEVGLLQMELGLDIVDFSLQALELGLALRERSRRRLILQIELIARLMLLLGGILGLELMVKVSEGGELLGELSQGGFELLLLGLELELFLF